jgi:hypothetical protein
MFTESSQDEANKSAKMLKSQVDMPFGVSVEKVESKKHAKGGEIIIWVQKENTSPKELYKEVKNLNEFKKELENLKKTGYYSMGGVKKSTYDKRGFYSKGGETPKTYFEYVYWNEITDDPKDDNDGYIYGINIVDGETYEVIDVSWFKTEKERDNAIEKYGLEEVDYDSNEYAKGGYMAKGGITKDELKEFKSYVKEHYGKDEIYDEFFPPTGASNDEIELAIRMYVSYCKTKDDQWGGGDTFDREIVRDVMLYNRGRKTNLEYQRAVKEIVKHYNNKSFEYGGILEPMIGGVNADPRFDIYNTTMFAKKGAELPKGGKVKSITERAKKLLEKYIKYRWVNTDMGSGWAFTLVSPKGDVLEERTYLDFFEPEDEDSNTKYYYEQWKEDMFETSYPDFRDRVTEDNLDWFIEFLQRDEDFAKGGETKDGKIKFYKVADEIRNLQYDGDPHDKRLHSETIFSWGAKDEDEYERAEKLIGKIGEKGNGWEVYATFDYSGYDYWMKQMQEPNYITIAVIFKDSYVDENEIGRIESAVYEAIMEAEKISNAFDYDPSKDKDDDDYAKGGKTHEQGYDDREDESLAMRHGKISSKDFVGSHHKKEHSRRDDAQFETRD